MPKAKLSMTRAEAAAALQCSTQTIDKMLRNGELPKIQNPANRRILIPVEAIKRIADGAASTLTHKEQVRSFICKQFK